jgi:hypothetical protein
MDAAVEGDVGAQITTQLDAGVGARNKEETGSVQTLTYSTALALTGRSAACAPLMARRPAAEPRMNFLVANI